ncbi:hypothetical protein [Aquipuribacter hungaricus]|uniref:hypothetical protein n=1 Tax=Aquipuribacter hungaricus TaxID=545624 RepID=UPI0036175497
MRTLLRRDDGASSLEYTGILLVLAVVVGVLGASIPPVARTATCAVESIVGGGAADCAPGDALASGPGSRAGRELLDRVDALEAWAAEGEGTRDLLEQARQAVVEGRLDAARELLDRLGLYRDLASSDPRGQYLRELFATSDSEYDALMHEGSIYHDGGAYSSSYFRLEDPPGGGVVVMDFFIDSATSGPLLGDDRDHADPLRDDVGLDRSRMMLVVDLETGRGQVHVTETCTAMRAFCNEPRPVVFDGSVWSTDTGTTRLIPALGNDFDQASQFSITPAEGGFRLEYDALNGITPVGISVDGTVSMHVLPDGTASIGEDDRDNYPSIGTYYYATPGQTQVVQQRDQEGVICGAMPVNIC